MKTKLCTLTRHAPRNQRGQAMIEFALIIPALVVMMVGVMDLARAIYAWGVISNAARTGAHYGALDAKNGALIAEKTMNSIQGLDKTKIILPGPVCSPNPDNTYMIGEVHPEEHLCDSWNYITVTVVYDFQPVLLLSNSIRMSTQSTMIIE